MQFSNQLTPTHMEFRKKLDELYGSSIYLDTSKRGDQHLLHVNADFVNQAFVGEQSITNPVLELIQAVLFKPLFEDPTFDPAVLTREKKQVLSRIESLYEDKARYAQHRLLQIIRPNHPASISASGTKEFVEQLNQQQLTDTYHSMLNEDEISIYVVGDIDSNEWVNLIQEYLPFSDRTARSYPLNTESVETKKASTTEYQDMKQGKLHMAYETSVTNKSKDFPVMQVLNGILGAYPHSKLFTNVREKESLAYYASSSFASSYGLLFATSGVDPSQKNKAEQVIDQQIAEIQNGNITDREFTQTKSMLKNQIQEIRDSARGMIEVFDSYQEIDPNFSIDSWSEKWSTITKDQVSELAGQIHKVHTYFLTGKEGSPNEATTV